LDNRCNPADPVAARFQPSHRCRLHPFVAGGGIDRLHLQHAFRATSLTPGKQFDAAILAYVKHDLGGKGIHVIRDLYHRLFDLIGGLIYAAVMLHVPSQWIVVDGIVLTGLGVLTGVKATRQKDPA
jgi:hypothetical protein